MQSVKQAQEKGFKYCFEPHSEFLSDIREEHYAALKWLDEVASVKSTLVITSKGVRIATTKKVSRANIQKFESFCDGLSFAGFFVY